MTDEQNNNISEMLNKRIDKFLNCGSFEFFYSEGEFKSLGLKWGESKRLTHLGFNRKEQIYLLNQIESDIKNKLLCDKCYKRFVKGVCFCNEDNFKRLKGVYL